MDSDYVDPDEIEAIEEAAEFLLAAGIVVKHIGDDGEWRYQCSPLASIATDEQCELAREITERRLNE